MVGRLLQLLLLCGSCRAADDEVRNLLTEAQSMEVPPPDMERERIINPHITRTLFGMNNRPKQLLGYSQMSGDTEFRPHPLIENNGAPERMPLLKMPHNVILSDPRNPPKPVKYWKKMAPDKPAKVQLYRMFKLDVRDLCKEVTDTFGASQKQTIDEAQPMLDKLMATSKQVLGAVLSSTNGQGIMLGAATTDLEKRLGDKAQFDAMRLNLHKALNASVAKFQGELVSGFCDGLSQGLLEFHTEARRLLTDFRTDFQTQMNDFRNAVDDSFMELSGTCGKFSAYCVDKRANEAQQRLIKVQVDTEKKIAHGLSTLDRLKQVLNSAFQGVSTKWQEAHLGFISDVDTFFDEDPMKGKSNAFAPNRGGTKSQTEHYRDGLMKGIGGLHFAHKALDSGLEREREKEREILDATNRLQEPRNPSISPPNDKKVKNMLYPPKRKYLSIWNPAKDRLPSGGATQTVGFQSPLKNPFPSLEGIADTVRHFVVDFADAGVSRLEMDKERLHNAIRWGFANPKGGWEEAQQAVDTMVRNFGEKLSKMATEVNSQMEKANDLVKKDLDKGLQTLEDDVGGFESELGKIVDTCEEQTMDAYYHDKIKDILYPPSPMELWKRNNSADEYALAKALNKRRSLREQLKAKQAAANMQTEGADLENEQVRVADHRLARVLNHNNFAKRVKDANTDEEREKLERKLMKKLMAQERKYDANEEEDIEMRKLDQETPQFVPGADPDFDIDDEFKEKRAKSQLYKTWKATKTILPNIMQDVIDGRTKKHPTSCCDLHQTCSAPWDGDKGLTSGRNNVYHWYKKRGITDPQDSNADSYIKGPPTCKSLRCAGGGTCDKGNCCCAKCDTNMDVFAAEEAAKMLEEMKEKNFDALNIDRLDRAGRVALPRTEPGVLDDRATRCSPGLCPYRTFKTAEPTPVPPPVVRKAEDDSKNETLNAVDIAEVDKPFLSGVVKVHGQNVRLRKKFFGGMQPNQDPDNRWAQYKDVDPTQRKAADKILNKQKASVDIDTMQDNLNMLHHIEESKQPGEIPSPYLKKRWEMTEEEGAVYDKRREAEAGGPPKEDALPTQLVDADPPLAMASAK